MNRCQGTGNSYTRLVESLLANPKKHMIFCLQSEQELLLALAAATQFKTSIIIGEVRIEVMRYNDKPGGVVEVYIVDSKEMYL